MGSKGVLSPSGRNHRTSFALVLAACRTVAIILIAGGLGIYMLKFLPKKSESGQEGSYVKEGSSTVLVDGVGHVMDPKQYGTRENKFFLSAVIVNRVFEKDLLNITAYECHQWLEYMLFAGVEHVFWYDTARNDNESQEAHLQEFKKNGVLTYHRLHHLFPGFLKNGADVEHDHAFEHFLLTHGGAVKWVVEMDVDEYPFMVKDVKQSFLSRHMAHLEIARPDVTQVLMPCMVFGGHPKGDLKNGWMIERYQRRKRVSEGRRDGFPSRTKPIFRAKHAAKKVDFYDPHEFSMTSGNTMTADSDVLRMNHYFGARLSDFKPDTAAVLALLIPDDSAQPIATELKKSSGLTSRALL